MFTFPPSSAWPPPLVRRMDNIGLRGLAVLLLLSAVLAQGAGTNQPAPVVFRVGLAAIVFRDINRNDALASYTAFLENRGRQLGIVYKPEPQIFDDTPSFEAAIQQQPMQMAVMDAWQFLTMDIHHQMKPYFTVMSNGQMGRKYVVLTRRDSGLTSLRALQGKDLLTLQLAASNVGKAWLDTLLLAEGLVSREACFSHVEVVSKPAAAILPVFFGKVPACLVDAPSFDIMTELNPQVGQRLQAIAVSDLFADGVVCLSENYWTCAKDKTDVIQSMRDAHLDPVGRQMCLLFKIDRMIPFADAQLNSIRQLRANYELLCDKDAARRLATPSFPPPHTNNLPLTDKFRPAVTN